MKIGAVVLLAAANVFAVTSAASFKGTSVQLDAPSYAKANDTKTQKTVKSAVVTTKEKKTATPSASSKTVVPKWPMNTSNWTNYTIARTPSASRKPTASQVTLKSTTKPSTKATSTKSSTKATSTKSSTSFGTTASQSSAPESAKTQSSVSPAVPANPETSSAVPVKPLTSSAAVQAKPTTSSTASLKPSASSAAVQVNPAQ